MGFLSFNDALYSFIFYLFEFLILTSCVSRNQCQGDGLLDVRGAGDYICEDISQICCHQSVEPIEDDYDIDDIGSRNDVVG